jgi:RNA polymerase sigma-70 factor (ECF subfamily)
MAVQKHTAKESGSHEERFLRAFEEYNDALFRHAFIRVSDRDRAIDIVHDTYAKVWTYIRSGHEVDAYRPFLYKVLNNLIIDEYRKHKESSLDLLLEEEGKDEGSFDELSQSSVEEMINLIDGKQAFALIEQLPDIYREVLVFRYVDGLGPKEISDLVEQSENVVSVRLFRALKELKQLVDQGNEVAEQKRKQQTQ